MHNCGEIWVGTENIWPCHKALPCLKMFSATPCVSNLYSMNSDQESQDRVIPSLAEYYFCALDLSPYIRLCSRSSALL